MTTLAQRPVSQVDADQLSLIADDWTPTKRPFADRFKAACESIGAEHDGWVDPNLVRARLLDGDVEFTLAEAKQYAGLWCKAAGKGGFLDTHRDVLVPISGAGSTRNGGKSLPMRRLRRWSS